MQQVLADEDAFSVFSLAFTYLCNERLRLLYVLALVIWALLNVSETGLQLSLTKNIPGLNLLRPYFCLLVANEMKLI